MTAAIAEAVAIPLRVPVWRLNVDQYHAMIRSGILTEDDPVELLEGLLVPKMPKNPRHRATTCIVRDLLERVIPAGWYVDSQEPITTADSEPEPDVAIIRGNTRDYLDRHPGSEDVALVVEVADSTLQRDREFKKRLYARAGIPVYWIVNLVDCRLEIYTEPTGPAESPTYLEQQNYPASDTAPVVIAGDEVAQVSLRELIP